MLQGPERCQDWRAGLLVSELMVDRPVGIFVLTLLSPPGTNIRATAISLPATAVRQETRLC